LLWIFNSEHSVFHIQLVFIWFFILFHLKIIIFALNFQFGTQCVPYSIGFYLIFYTFSPENTNICFEFSIRNTVCSIFNLFLFDLFYTFSYENNNICFEFSIRNTVCSIFNWFLFDFLYFFIWKYLCFVWIFNSEHSVFHIQ